jgi:hypothetical protein
MTAANPTPPPPPRPPQSTALRYSMRSMLIIVTVVALLAAIVPYPGFRNTLFIAALIALMFVGPVCLGTLALYCRGYKQTFFGGAFAGSLSTFYLNSTLMPFTASLGGLLVLCIVGAASAGACACAAVATRRFVERRGWNKPAAGPEYTSGK